MSDERIAELERELAKEKDTCEDWFQRCEGPGGAKDERDCLTTALGRPGDVEAALEKIKAMVGALRRFADVDAWIVDADGLHFWPAGDPSELAAKALEGIPTEGGKS